MSASLSYDESADVLYVRLNDGARVRTEIVDDFRLVDYAEGGLVVGVEFLNASEGVQLNGLPGGKELSALLQRTQFLRQALPV
jgi:uncharacterized protein YuzE